MSTGKAQVLPVLLEEVRRCRLCVDELPLGPRPVLRASASARLLIIGQAPGTRVHASGIPWDDPSGERLRGWLKMGSELFYDEGQVAIVPMGLCYPGKGKSGDLPPIKRCAPTWHEALRAQLRHIELVLLIGQYAQRYYLPAFSSVTAAVKSFDQAPAPYFPLPHPSPRNALWLRKNPWFERECLPALRERVGALGLRAPNDCL